MARDFYQDLGVSRTATTEEIRKSYRKLAAKLHPDRHPDDPKAEERFKDVNRAFHALTDEKKRALYDEFGEVGLREGFDAARARQYSQWHQQSGQGPDLSDLFGAAAPPPPGQKPSS